jgi:hypothetical protein
MSPPKEVSSFFVYQRNSFQKIKYNAKEIRETDLQGEAPAVVGLGKWDNQPEVVMSLPPLQKIPHEDAAEIHFFDL